MSGTTRRTFLGGTAALAGGIVLGVAPLGMRLPAARAATADDITFALSTLTLTPGATPTATHNTDQAFAILTDGITDYGTNPGVVYDFTGVATAQSYVDVTATFIAVADPRLVTLTTALLDSSYAVPSAQVTFNALDNTFETVNAQVIKASGAQLVTITGQPTKSKPIISVQVRVFTANKVDLTELALAGTAHGLVGLTVTDPVSATHIHTAGTVFTVSVQPGLIAYGDITQLAALTATPGGTPFASENTGEVQALLTDGITDYGSNYGLEYDFFDVDPSLCYVDVRADFAQPATIESVTLDGFNLNSYYAISAATVTFLDASGNTVATDTPVIVSPAEGGACSATLDLTSTVQASSVVVRAHCTYKINLTELSITGSTHGDVPLPDPDLTAAWFDYQGNQLTSSVPLTVGRTTQINSPAAPELGYYGLVVRCSDAVVFDNHIVGETREYGFAVLPPPVERRTATDPGSLFGTVQANLNDLYQGGWVKSAVWDTSTPFVPSDWTATIAARTDLGLIELPIVSGGDWDSTPDTSPVPAAQLTALYNRLLGHFQAAPSVPAYELGIEENLGDNGAAFESAQYMANLDAKVTVARQAVADAGTSTRLIFQIAEPNARRDDVSAFLNSAAAHKFDILSLHPYAWPDFPSPETWMADMLSFVREQMAASGVELPIWFTEVGAPQAINYPGGFFGYVDDTDPANPVYTADTGKPPSLEPQYLLKIYVLGLQHQVEKIFWYNYQNWGTDRWYPEDSFGMVDYWGFPTPAYLAYATAVRMLDNRVPAGLSNPVPGLYWAKFSGTDDDVYVGWSYPHTLGTVPWHQVGLTIDQVTAISTINGGPVPVTSPGARIDAEPVYITVTKAAS